MLAWERQPDESDKAYYAFSLYRDLGPERSLRAVAEAVYGTRWEHGKRTVEKWSSKHGWVDRVRALEARDAMIRREAVEEHLRGRAEDHAKREAELRDKALEARERAMDKALTMLQWPLTEQRAVREDEDGRGQTLIFMPAKWSLANASTLYQMAVGGAPGEEDPDLAEWDFSELTEDEMEAYIEASEKIRFKRPGRSEGV